MIQREKILQNQVLCWLNFYKFLAYHIPNRGLYSGRTKRYNIVDKWFVPGVPDIEVILSEGRTVRIELKDRAGVVSEAQEKMLERLAALGHEAFVARDLETVETYFRQHGYIK